MSYLIDTNVLIDLQMGRIPEKGIEFLNEILKNNFNISFITYIEYIGYNHLTNQMIKLIEFANIIETDRELIDKCIEIRKSQKIKLPDAIIAATALVSEFKLITRNTKDFENINNLETLNLWEI